MASRVSPLAMMPAHAQEKRTPGEVKPRLPVCMYRYVAIESSSRIPRGGIGNFTCTPYRVNGCTVPYSKISGLDSTGTGTVLTVQYTCLSTFHRVSRTLWYLSLVGIDFQGRNGSSRTRAFCTARCVFLHMATVRRHTILHVRKSMQRMTELLCFTYD